MDNTGEIKKGSRKNEKADREDGREWSEEGGITEKRET